MASSYSGSPGTEPPGHCHRCAPGTAAHRPGDRGLISAGHGEAGNLRGHECFGLAADTEDAVSLWPHSCPPSGCPCSPVACLKHTCDAKTPVSTTCRHFQVLWRLCHLLLLLFLRLCPREGPMVHQAIAPSVSPGSPAAAAVLQKDSTGAAQLFPNIPKYCYGGLQ